MFLDYISECEVWFLFSQLFSDVVKALKFPKKRGSSDRNFVNTFESFSNGKEIAKNYETQNTIIKRQKTFKRLGL
jgi:hypothetical protein